MSLYIPITFSAIPQLLEQGIDQEAINYVLKLAAIKYTRLVQSTCPVDTGNLRASLRVDMLPDDMGVAITSFVYYAGFVNFGTKRMSPRNYADRWVGDIVSEVNANLSALSKSSITIGPTRIVNNTDELYTGGTNSTISNQATFNRVRPNFVRGVSVGSIKISPVSIQNAGVTGDLIESEFIQS